MDTAGASLYSLLLKFLLVIMYVQCTFILGRILVACYIRLDISVARWYLVRYQLLFSREWYDINYKADFME